MDAFQAYPNCQKCGKQGDLSCREAGYAQVFFVHLRHPKRSDPNEQRDDPFYESGSLGCTLCHSKNLFNPRHAADLAGARLAFVQGGQLGSRLVFLTPPIIVKVWKGCCEAIWTPAEMPFKYAKAPVLAQNGEDSDFPLIERFARETNCRTFESGLSSRLRSRVRQLPADLAREVVAVYKRMRAKASDSDISSTYDEALPYAPPKVDRSRKATYRRRIQKLAADVRNRDCGSRAKVLTKMRVQSGCGSSQSQRTGS